MTLIIPHPTEELKLIEFQKELILDFFSDDRILYRNSPLWLKLPQKLNATSTKELKELSKKIKEVKAVSLEMSDNSIELFFYIKTSEEEFSSKLTLVRIHDGKTFTASERQLLSEKKEPVNQLKVFRLAIEEELSPIARAISASVWCKLHYPASAVK